MFRTPVYLESKAYSEHCQTSTVESFVKKLLPNALFKPKLKKKKKRSTQKKFLIFQGMKLSGPNVKKFLTFSQKKAFLIFREMELFYILENQNLKKFSYFRKQKP